MKLCRVSAVIVAAGSSSRMGFDKLFAEVGGVPVIALTISAYNSCDMVDEIIVVTGKASMNKMADLCRSYRFSKVKKVVLGGAERSASSLAGVCQTDTRSQIVLIHDGARPFVSGEQIRTVIHAAMSYKAAAPGIPPKDTIKSVSENFVAETLNRSSLRCIQTPQGFDAAVIKAALTKVIADGFPVTDDCSAVEYIGVRPRIVEGDERNIKLTTPDDMKKAEMIARDWRLKVTVK